MRIKMSSALRSQGFTLVEMAIVLAIIGLLIAGLLLPLSVQRDLRDYAETRAELSELREALIGYALSHTATDGRPYLPCPDTSGNGSENREVAGGCTSSAGNVPWETLGLGQSDSWNNTYLYRVTPAYSNSVAGFTLGNVGPPLIPPTAGDNTILDSVGGASIATNIPAVLISKGKNGFGAAADEVENSVNDPFFVSHEIIDVAANQFDDIVVWVPSTILFNRMVTAGKLP